MGADVAMNMSSPNCRKVTIGIFAAAAHSGDLLALLEYGRNWHVSTGTSRTLSDHSDRRHGVLAQRLPQLYRARSRFATARCAGRKTEVGASGGSLMG